MRVGGMHLLQFFLQLFVVVTAGEFRKRRAGRTLHVGQQRNDAAIGHALHS